MMMAALAPSNRPSPMTGTGPSNFRRRWRSRMKPPWHHYARFLGLGTRPRTRCRLLGWRRHRIQARVFDDCWWWLRTIPPPMTRKSSSSASEQQYVAACLSYFLNTSIVWESLWLFSRSWGSTFGSLSLRQPSQIVRHIHQELAGSCLDEVINFVSRIHNSCFELSKRTYVSLYPILGCFLYFRVFKKYFLFWYTVV